MRNLKAVVILLLGIQFAFSQTKYAGAYLEVGVGARALGMGSAHVALSEDVYGFHWNPAGLAFLSNFQAGTMYSEMFNSLSKQSFVSAAMPIFGGATIAASWVRMSVDDIPEYVFDKTTTSGQRVFGGAAPLIGDPNGFFSNTNDAFIFSFAKYQQIIVDLGWQYFEFPIDFGYGANVKVLQQNLKDNTGSGVGLDIGLILKIALKNVFDNDNYGDLTFGLNVQDIANTRITWDTDSKQKDDIERNFKYGFAYVQPFNGINSSLALAYDLDSRYNGGSHLGTEFVYDQLLAVRVGLNQGDFTTGAGVYIWKFKVDYAYQSHVLGNTHRVSLLFNF